MKHSQILESMYKNIQKVRIRMIKKGYMSLFFIVFLTGCASYQYKVSEARKLLSQGQPQAAALKLKPLANETGTDQLVYLFDYGSALQISGDYPKSNEAFLQSDKLIDFKDYVSISKQAASVLTSERMVQYKGEEYEKVLVNAMLAINFLMLNDLDSALVEARRVNEKLTLLNTNGEKKYHQNEFALYLSALIWEANQDWDDAYIAYNDVYKLSPKIPNLQEDLLRTSMKAKRWQAHKKWEKAFNKKPKKEWTDKSYGEVVLLYLQGWAPRKQPHPQSFRFPYLYAVDSFVDGLKVVATKSQQQQQARTVNAELTDSKPGSSLPTLESILKESVAQSEATVLYDLEERAVKTFNDAQAALIAKRLAALAAKKAVADEVRKNNEGLGDLIHFAMLISDQADLRQWSTLPETFQVARLWLPEGEYDLHFINKSYTGELLEINKQKKVTVKANKKTFLLHRTF